MDDIVLELEVRKEVVAEEDVAKHLRVPVEDVCVALALLKGLNQRMELEITRALQGGQRVRELKVVEVSQDDHVRVGIEGENLADEIPHRLRLGIALRLRSAHRGLETAKQGIVLGLGFPVVAITKSFLPWALNSPTSGLRTPSGLDQAVLPGSMRPGLTES